MSPNKLGDTLVILSPGFPANEADSTCLPAQQAFVRALNKNYGDLKIIIVSFQYPFTQAEYTWHGNRVIPLNGRNKGKMHRIAVWVQSWKILQKIKKENKITGLFSFWCTECALVGKYFGKKHTLANYTWILGQDARKSNKFVRWINPHGGNLVAMSASLSKEFYKNHFIRPKYIIHNGIDPSLYVQANAKRDIDIIGVGSLIPLKQYDLFIDIIKELSAEFPLLKTLICGGGPQSVSLQSQANQLKLTNNITLAGEMPHAEVLQLMQRSRIFLHTSNYEGFSSVCLEALYAGAHVISFCNPEIGLVNHWHIVNSKAEMIQKTIELLMDPAPDHSPVLAFSMDDTAKAVRALFD
jgi:glycosyltransferase involved in cell wall biosynthesis